MNLKFLSDVRELEGCQSNWDAIAGESPFLSYAWMMNWYRALGRDLKLALLIAEDENGDWVGIAPWCIDETGPFSRKLRMLGTGVACSDYLDLICKPGIHRAFAQVAVDWLVANIGDRNTLGRIDVIELEGVTPENPRTNFLCDLFEAHGLKSHTVDLEGGWVVELPDQWDQLNANLSKSMRRKTRKAVQRVEHPSTKVRSSDDQPFEELWPIFKNLHQQRRELLGQAGCFANRCFEDFLESATRGLIEQGKAELLIVEFESRPLGAMLLINDKQTVFMYQSGMDTERLKLEPGHLTAYCAITRAIGKGFKGFDFLRGDEPYKARWNSRRIPIQRIRFIPKTPVANVKHGLWRTGYLIKNCLRSNSTQQAE